MTRTRSFADEGEILDSMITRSRGEIRRTCSSKSTSSTATPFQDIKGIESPSVSFSDKVYSPRVTELRGDHSPQVGGRTPLSPRSMEMRPSNLGKSG